MNSQNKTPNCMWCSEGGESNVSQGHCKQCNQWLCTECIKGHNRMPPFRSHTINIVGDCGDKGILSNFYMIWAYLLAMALVRRFLFGNRRLYFCNQDTSPSTLQTNSFSNIPLASAHLSLSPVDLMSCSQLFAVPLLVSFNT